MISEPKEEFQRNTEPEKVKFITKVLQYQILKGADLSFNFQWSVDFKLDMRRDKKDVSKIEEAEENRQAYVTNVVYREKEDNLEVTQKLDNVTLEEKAPLHCHRT